MPKIIVCKGCENVMAAIDRKTGKPACIICYGINKDNSIPIEIDIPEELHCVCKNCESIAKWEDNSFTVTLSKKGGWNCTNGTITKGLKPKDIPFINTKEKTFYCGCLGWD